MKVADIPYIDLQRQHRELRSEILGEMEAALDQTAFVGGRRVADFESAFASFCGARHAVGVGNGTDAIKLALRAAGIGAGDEVILPAFTFVATAGAVVDCGAVPVLADVDERTALLCPKDAAARVTPRTRAVIPVHLYGLPLDPAPLRDAMRGASQPVTIVEDCAQSHGASWRGKRAGSLADAAAFSFYPTKNLGALGDGGAVTTDDDGLARRVREIADHGRPADPAKRDEHVIPGLNSRLDALQASMLRVKLERLADWNALRAAVARRYVDALAGRDDVSVQRVPEGAVHAWHVFAFRHAQRDALMPALLRHGVQARVVYPKAVHEYPAYASLAPAGSLPRAEAWAREVVTLPMFTGLRVDEGDRVIEATLRALDEVASGR
jgi:dTDP-4-amino-4,6-dideoxygalactose transaminase